MKSLRTLLFQASLLSALATVAWSQELAYPRLGYIFDARSGALLHLAGIPGAALASPAAIDGADLSPAAVSNERRYALGAAGDSVVLVDLAAAQVPRPLDLEAGPRRILLSPGGEAALLDYGGKVCVVRGLPAEPQTRCYPLEGGTAALAVSDQGAAIVAAPGGVLLLDGERGVALPAPAAVKAAAFRQGSDDAVLASPGETWLASGVRGVPSLRALPVAAAEPAAAAFSRDGSRVYVADAAEGAVAELTLATSAVRTAACGCRPEGLQRLAGNGVFYLIDTGSPVVRLFDGDAPEPRAVFVPIPSGEAN